MATELIISINEGGGVPVSSSVKETALGIRFRKRIDPLNSGPGLENGDVGVDGILSDGRHLISGIYTGNGVNEIDPDSWNIIFSS